MTTFKTYFQQPMMLVNMEIQFNKPVGNYLGRLIFFQGPMTKSYTKAAMIYIGEMYGKWRSPQGDICYYFYCQK